MTTGDRIDIGNGWSLWADFALRGAGFPARTAHLLRSPELAAAADAVLAAEDATAAARQLDRGDPRRRAAADEVERARAAYERLSDMDRAQARAGVVSLTEDPRFREAVLWQNPGAFATAVEAVRAGRVTGQRRVKSERLVAMYGQRYALKNDSVGFFGPVSWGRFTLGGVNIEAKPGPIIAERHTYLEYWAVDAIARKLSNDPDVRRSVAPRRHPLVRVDGRVVHSPFGAMELPGLLGEVLARCDGATSAADIATSLRGTIDTVEEAAVLAAIEQLRDMGLASWQLEVPTCGSPYESRLRALVARVTDPAARERAENQLRRVEAAVEAVTAAAGSVEPLATALAELDRCFVEITGEVASHSPGETYAARTTVHHDCRRGGSLELGGRVLSRLAPPLEAVLSTLRWLTHELVRVYTQELLPIHRDLAAEGVDGGRVPLADFWGRAQRVFATGGGEEPAAVRAVRAQYQSKWAAALGVTAGATHVDCSLAQVRTTLEREFAAPGPGWPMARIHSPDIMLAADGVEAIQRGDFLFVLGELHVAINTTEVDVLAAVHPDRGRFVRMLREDFPGGRVHILPPKRFSTRRRVYLMSRLPSDVCVESRDAVSYLPRSSTVQVADLVTVERDGRLFIETRDGSRAWSGIDFLNDLLVSDAAFFPEMPHTPRVTLEGMVLARESWRFSSEELREVCSKVPRLAFLDIRRWARRRGLPTKAFFKVASERKPCFVDFDSSVLVENFARLVSRAGSVAVSEMLPGEEQLWLHDAEGERYTCELRLVAVDARSPE